MNPVTLPIAEQPPVFFAGHDGFGVCFVFPMTFAFDAPADGMRTTATSVAHSAANASAYAARRLALGVPVLVSPIGLVNTRAPAGFR
jgi:hypothetical protein